MTFTKLLVDCRCAFAFLDQFSDPVTHARHFQAFETLVNADKFFGSENFQEVGKLNFG